jgi:hypothetical protein
MIQRGPLADMIPDAGVTRINLPYGGWVEPVTSKATSSLGQPITLAIQDETGIWTKQNGGHALARTQRRGLAGMSGRSIETTNAWNPAELSVAQMGFESKVADIYRDYRQPPRPCPTATRSSGAASTRSSTATPGGSTSTRSRPRPPRSSRPTRRRRAVLREPRRRRLGRMAADWAVGEGLPWRAGCPTRLTARAICLGMDGSDVDDWTAIRAETVDGFQFTPRVLGGRPSIWNPAEHYDHRIPAATSARR